MNNSSGIITPVVSVSFPPAPRFPPMRLKHFFYFLVLINLAITTGHLKSADEFERSPIQYSLSTPKNCITKLQEKMDKGSTKLTYDGETGYLGAVLKALQVPLDSQMLVFSKTSLQLRHITPKTPRAVYFNEDVYVGYCQSGDVLEISAVDPNLGTVFYTLDQQQIDAPQFIRRVDKCLICHSSSRTEGVPGHLVRSLFVDYSGQPMLSGGSRTVDHTTPIDQRWGGWYVTGKHGHQNHLGNLVIRGRDVPRDVDNSQGQNVVSLKDRLDLGRYLTPHSDIVALMVLEHQTLVHNRMTKANFTARQAFDYEHTLNEALGEPKGNRLESTTRRIQSAGDDLIEAMLFVEEAKITSPISGTSGFAENFSKKGPKDKKGRSLHQLDLQQRMLKYPCSHLIYSDSFDALHPEMRKYIWQKLWDIFNNKDNSKKYSHLSVADRMAILEIIRDTKSGLPDYWKASH